MKNFSKVSFRCFQVVDCRLVRAVHTGKTLGGNFPSLHSPRIDHAGSSEKPTRRVQCATTNALGESVRINRAIESLPMIREIAADLRAMTTACRTSKEVNESISIQINELRSLIVRKAVVRESPSRWVGLRFQKQSTIEFIARRLGQAVKDDRMSLGSIWVSQDDGSFARESAVSEPRRFVLAARYALRIARLIDDFATQFEIDLIKSQLRIQKALRASTDAAGRKKSRAGRRANVCDRDWRVYCMIRERWNDASSGMSARAKRGLKENFVNDLNKMPDRMAFWFVGPNDSMTRGLDGGDSFSVKDLDTIIAATPKTKLDRRPVS